MFATGFHWFRPPKPRKAFAPLDLTGCDKAGHHVPAGEMPYAWTNCSVWNYEVSTCSPSSVV